MIEKSSIFIIWLCCIHFKYKNTILYLFFLKKKKFKNNERKNFEIEERLEGFSDEHNNTGNQ